MKRIINFIKYRRLLDKLKMELSSEFGIKIDSIYRLGRFMVVSNKKMELLRGYNEAELDIHEQLDNEVKKFISKLDRYFMINGLVEFIGLSKAERVQDNAVEIVMSYRFMNMANVANIIRIIMGISILLIIISSVIGIPIMIYFQLSGLFLLIMSIVFNFILFKKLFV